MGSSDRRPYESAMILNQAFLDASHDSLVNQLELIVDIEAPDGSILHLSDRNKYVGGTFYEARLVFPLISRTIGEYLSPELEFESLQLEINNADEAFNHILPAGDDFEAWVGKRVTAKLGLRDVASTYTTIFSGVVTEEGGFQRTVKSFILLARNDFDKFNVSFPSNVFTTDTYPDLDPNFENAFIPIIYGDWTVNVEPGMASVPAYPVNGANANVTGEGSPHDINVLLVISDNDLTLFDTSEVYLKRGSLVVKFDSADIVNVGAGNKSFEIRQSGTTPAAITLVDGAPFDYERGDEFFVKVKGKDLGAYDDNIVAIAKDILLTYAGAVSGDFDANWDTYRDKASPTESAISTFKARVHRQDAEPALTFVLSLLEQVRLEAFIDRNLNLKLSSTHLEDFDPSPTFSLKNWDIEEGSFQPKLDERNNFNRAQGVFNFLPNRNENLQATRFFKNVPAISQAGKEISKRLVYPNLYEQTVVENQIKEVLKLVSSYLENVYVNATWRALLLDIGNFVSIEVSIQGTIFENVPALIREIGYDPQGIKIPLRLWSFQMTPFPGWSPGYAGIVGGSTATITEE